MSAYVGQQLRQARQNKNLSLEQVSRATYIRVSYLEALEAGQLDYLPSLAQARGFLRTYAKQLGMPSEPLIAALDREEPAANGETSPPPEPDQPAPPTETVFAEIGQTLRQHREMLGLKLEDVERQTRVRVHYLQALEKGNLDTLPSPVQGRGMLNNYAAFLGIDPDPLLLKFADGLQARLLARRGPRKNDPRASTSRPGEQKPSIRRYLSNDLIFGGTLGVALLIFIVWGVIRVSTLGAAAQASPTAPAIVDVLAPEATPSPTSLSGTPSTELASDAEPGESSPLPPEIDIPSFTEDTVQLYIIVQQRAWMRVVVDGETEFEGRVIPGSAYTFSGQERIDFLTGSGSALQVFYNQNDLGPLGLFGEVVQRTFTPDGIILPTPTITSTPTITNTPEATFTPEATATLSP